MEIKPCPENWQYCDFCGAGPNENCRNPDVNATRPLEEADCHSPTLLNTGIKLEGTTTKPTNPKEAVGVRKVPMSTVSGPVMAEVGVAMLEGARKYGRHNYRESGIRASVYYDATLRHLMQWWEGEDTDPDSGLSHVAKAITSLVVLRDAMIFGQFNDDRPPALPDGWLRDLQPVLDQLFGKYPTEAKACTQIAKTEG